jgi:hypothetical protein
MFIRSLLNVQIANKMGLQKKSWQTFSDVLPSALMMETALSSHATRRVAQTPWGDFRVPRDYNLWLTITTNTLVAPDLQVKLSLRLNN